MSEHEEVELLEEDAEVVEGTYTRTHARAELDSILVHPLTDLGNVYRFVDRWSDRLAYMTPTRTWYAWDNARWQKDVGNSVVTECAKETALRILDEVDQIADLAGKDEDEACVRLMAEVLKEWAHKCQAGPKYREIVRGASTTPELRRKPEHFDTDRYLFNVANGTINLRTGELQPHQKSDMLTRVSGIEYDPDAECPRWEEFLSWVACDRPELVEFLWRCIGYTMVGTVPERVVIFLYGTGHNGKSLMLRVLRELFGDYGIKVRSAILRQANSVDPSRPTPHIAELRHARFVTTSELEQGSRLAAGLLKDITGNESLRARNVWGVNQEWFPEFTPWVSSNHRPIISHNESAVFARLRLVPFDAVWTGPQTDELYDELITELPGILAWAVRGALAWQRDGLQTPEIVTAAGEEYRAAMDTFTEWLEQLPEYIAKQRIEDPTYELATGKAAMRDLYNGWARHNGHEHLPQSAFNTEMRDRGWIETRSNRGHFWEPPDDWEWEC